MDLSIVDLSPVPAGGTAADAYANTVTAAEQAERLGYSRFWVAEHHGMGDHLAGTTPEVLLGRLAGATDSIRLGTGAVLLNHYSPYKVAEAFGTLDGLAPGRIDAGLGRANGSPASDRALGTDRRVENPDEDHEERIRAVVNHLYDAFPDDHPYADLTVPRSGAAPPVPWVLGSSPASAAIAGKLGARFCFAAFIRPGFAERAFAAYREQFEPAELSETVPMSRTGWSRSTRSPVRRTRPRRAPRASGSDLQADAARRGGDNSLRRGVDRGTRRRSRADARDARSRRMAASDLREPGDDRGTARTAR